VLTLKAGNFSGALLGQYWWNYDEEESNTPDTSHGSLLYSAWWSLPQAWQGVTSGGRDKHDEYGGTMDYQFNLDGSKLFGSWDGIFCQPTRQPAGRIQRYPV
jgi:hypothetical protein